MKNLRFMNDTMLVVIDGKEHSFSLKRISPSLHRSSTVERETFRIDKYGYGIHWPLIDEDLSIDGLIGVKHKPPNFKKKAAV